MVIVEGQMYARQRRNAVANIFEGINQTTLARLQRKDDDDDSADNDTDNYDDDDCGGMDAAEEEQRRRSIVDSSRHRQRRNAVVANDIPTDIIANLLNGLNGHNS